MYQDVLLATDGSDGANQATAHAIDLAQQLEASLHVVTVSEDGPHSSEKRDELRHDHEDEAVQVLEDAERATSEAGIDATTTLRHGVPQDEIIATAEELGCDLIVVGTVGRSGLENVLVGSVAEEVVRNASVPVVTVRET
ncbi:universal stress protein [Natronolimnobius baerhuensis]|uniref:Universal stress protein UspA n=1 Tax=Natronolimnobius baerhuensis TaxID=253108 RepID=A0A202ECQ7_9EURY|nr:universal stress protein [Natronolimnobius baerhuensis]OVE86012.1 universal stress protein UspA [Natronolimnobius baerhuensis]